MEIDINQKKIAIGDKYNVFINGNPSHVASTELFRLRAVIHLFNATGAQGILTINKRNGIFRVRYDITFADGNVYQFVTKSFWKKHFQCQHGSDVFDVYGHRGRKFSIYKSDEQVAWWDKQKVKWFDGDNYKIIADDKCDHELLIAFCLILDNHLSSHKGKNTITIDFGHIGPQARKFNKDWQPSH